VQQPAGDNGGKCSEDAAVGRGVCVPLIAARWQQQQQRQRRRQYLRLLRQSHLLSAMSLAAAQTASGAGAPH